MKVNPVVDSVWTRCFLEVYDRRVSEGAMTIPLEDVDKLVVEKSKEMTVEEFMRWLKGDEK